MSTAGTQPHPWVPATLSGGWKARLLLLSALLLLVPQVTGSLPWLYQHASLPVKPRDWTLLFTGLTLLLVLISRPAFCLPTFALFILPLWRVADAAILQRYRVESVEGGPDAFVMILLGNYLVSAAAILVLAAPSGERVIVWFASASILICSGANFYEWAGFEEFTRIPGRVAGFLVDPNQSPITLCLLFGALFTLCRSFWWNVFLMGVGGAAIALTLSRSGMAVFAAMAFCYLLANLRRHLSGLVALALIATPLVGGGIAILAETSERRGVVRDENASARLEAIYELDFEKLKSPERAKDLTDGWEAVAGAVLAGYGTGAGTNQWQPHNQAVSLWLDNGVFAVALYLGTIFLTGLQGLRLRSPGLHPLIPVVLFIPCSQILLENAAYWHAIAVSMHAIFPRRFALGLAARRGDFTAPSRSLSASAT